MPNHYHLLVRVKEASLIINTINETNNRLVLDNANVLQYVRQQISNFHNSYAKSFNKIHQRRGSLFQTKPKSKEIVDLVDLLEIFRYIHNNPQKHGIVSDLNDWEYSSYLDYCGVRELDFLRKDEIMKHFSSLEEVKKFIGNNLRG
jgi:REP element-mobilizing transposase RayT